MFSPCPKTHCHLIIQSTSCLSPEFPKFWTVLTLFISVSQMFPIKSKQSLSCDPLKNQKENYCQYAVAQGEQFHCRRGKWGCRKHYRTKVRLKTSRENRKYYSSGSSIQGKGYWHARSNRLGQLHPCGLATYSWHDVSLWSLTWDIVHIPGIFNILISPLQLRLSYT